MKFSNLSYLMWPNRFRGAFKIKIVLKLVAGLLCLFSFLQGFCTHLFGRYELGALYHQAFFLTATISEHYHNTLQGCFYLLDRHIVNYN